MTAAQFAATGLRIRCTLRPTQYPTLADVERAIHAVEKWGRR